jgi:hypothetical protein
MTMPKAIFCTVLYGTALSLVVSDIAFVTGLGKLGVFLMSAHFVHFVLLISVKIVNRLGVRECFYIEEFQHTWDGIVLPSPHDPRWTFETEGYCRDARLGPIRARIWIRQIDGKLVFDPELSRPFELHVNGFILPKRLAKKYVSRVWKNRIDKINDGWMIDAKKELAIINGFQPVPEKSKLSAFTTDELCEEITTRECGI